MSYLDYVGATSMPLALWGLDETAGSVAIDDTGNGHDGAHSSGVSVGEPPLMVGGQACAYANGAHTVVGDAPALQSFDSAFSAEFWVYSGLSSPDDQGVVLDKWHDATYGDSGSTDYGISVRLENDGQFRIWVGNGSNNNGGPRTKTNSVLANTVHYVAITVDTRFVIVDVDDETIAYIPNGIGVGGIGADLWLGARRLGGAKLDGTLDGVGIYDRILARTEKRNHYLAGSLGTVEFSGTDHGSFGTEVRAIGWNNGALLGRATTDPNNGSYTLHAIKGDSQAAIVTFPATGVRPKAHGPFPL